MTDIALGSGMAMEWLSQILILNGRLLLLLAVGLLLIRRFGGSASRRHLLIAAIFFAAFLLPFSSQWIPAVEIIIPVELPLSDAKATAAASGITAASTQNFWQKHWPQLLLCGYGAIALLLIGRLLFGNSRILHLYTLAHRHSLRGWQLSLQDCANLLDIKQSIDIRHSPHISSPMTWGFWQPVILIPSSALQWPENLRRSALLHELAHIKRKDCLTKQAAGMICAMYWLNPLCWLALRQLNNDAESASDDTALSSGIKYSHYAQNLVHVAKQARQFSPAPASVLTMVTPERNNKRSEFGQRVLAILNPDGCRTPINWTYLLLSFLFVFCVLLPISSLRASVVQEIRYVVNNPKQLIPMPPPAQEDLSTLFEVNQPTQQTPPPPLLSDFIPQPIAAVEYREIPTAEVLSHATDKMKNALTNIRKDKTTSQSPAANGGETVDTKLATAATEKQVVPATLDNDPVADNLDKTSQQPLNLASLLHHHAREHLFTEAPRPWINATQIEPYIPERVVTPHYPRRAQSRGIEGELTVEFGIDSTGEVVDARIINASPSGVFDRAVLKALQQNRYQPQRIDGKAVAVSGVQEKYVFVLES